jgi:hypothetical protein
LTIQVVSLGKESLLELVSNIFTPKTRKIKQFFNAANGKGSKKTVHDSRHKPYEEHQLIQLPALNDTVSKAIEKKPVKGAQA